jgi:gliding motility-associated-like protein/uncharacterized repeat protein (TIGR01451 family)
MKVYARVGEVIYTGSSAQGFGAGTINLRAPNGDTYSSGNSQTIGFIANRAQELAGPLPNASGYTPFVRPVLAGQEGVWEIDFISQSGGAAAGGNPVPVPSNANWSQPGGQYITAFDVSVRNVTNTAFLTGRVFTNVFTGILGTFDVGFNGVFKVLTKDGYQYTLDNNGQAGNGFSFFVNNKGFRDASGAPSYKSVNTIVNPNIHDPRLPDTNSDVSHKIFFNDPASDLPSAANIPGGGTTWLLDPPLVPTLTNVAFNGAEGSANRMGTNPLGAVFSFNANKNGSYIISVDVNKNGVFTDAIDRKLTGTVNAGANQVLWDGLDGFGTKVPSSGATPYSANLNIVLYGGEVHFPFFDVERNVNGLKLTRTNGFASPDNSVYWDDTPVDINGTPSNPLKNISGLNSFVNGHKWGTSGAGPTEFGDETGLDTWSYISAAPLIATLTFDVREADLQIAGIDVLKNCKSTAISYTVLVKNNGPDNVSGAKFSFKFPPELTVAKVSSSATTGNTVLGSSVLTTTGYDVFLDMANGSSRTFLVSGAVPVPPAGGDITVTTSILRPADFTDPDATNPDAASPTDPLIECNSLPSGLGCNNLKSLSSFAGILDAGPDQIIRQFTSTTINASGLGTWAQLGTTPSQANISAPNSTSTTITGFNLLGKYEFIRTHENGCTDTVAIFVIASDGSVDIPNIFTPNGDGKNDLFVLKGLEAYPGSQLIVLNRWGNEVYRSNNYQNNWDGSNLADGTYFYVLTRKETGGSTVLKGWVYLKKK